MKNSHINNRRIKTICIFALIFISIVSIIFSIYTLVNNYIINNNQSKHIGSEQNNTAYYYDDYIKFENHIEELSILYDKYWEKASKEEKKFGAEQIMYTAVGCLNLPDKYYLNVEDLKYSVINNDYNNRIIEIDSYFLYTSSSYDVAQAIFHQVYKIYATNCIFALETTGPSYRKLDIFNKSRKYQEDMKNGGIYSECPYFGEYYKTIEEDSQKFSKEMSDSLFKYIGNYIYDLNHVKD